MVQLETMSPVVTLAPGETLRHTEVWAHSMHWQGAWEPQDRERIS